MAQCLVAGRSIPWYEEVRIPREVEVREFQDKVVTITGAGSGIGRALALAYAAEGARLHLAEIDAGRAGKVEAETRLQGADATAHVVDCARGAEVEALADSVFSAHGRVDVLHNNAGALVAGAAAEIALDDWRHIVDVNQWSVIHGVRAFVPRMIEQGGGGAIVNTASIAGLFGLPFVAPYSMTKFAIVGLSEALDAELAFHGIRVLALCPAAVRTNVMKDGRLGLPGAWGERLAGLMERHAPSPERAARSILRAVRREQGPVWVGPGGWPLWGLKRISGRAYALLARALTARALRSGGGVV